MILPKLYGVSSRSVQGLGKLFKIFLDLLRQPYLVNSSCLNKAVEFLSRCFKQLLYGIRNENFLKLKLTHVQWTEGYDDITYISVSKRRITLKVSDRPPEAAKALVIFSFLSRTPFEMYR